MKIILLVFLFQILVCVDSNNLLEPEEGLCSNTQTKCPDILQKNGICCRKNANEKLLFYRNNCLACLSVRIIIFRVANRFTTRRLRDKIVTRFNFRIYDFLMIKLIA